MALFIMLAIAAAIKSRNETVGNGLRDLHFLR